MNKSIPYKLSTTNDKFTSRSGLILPAEILRQMDVDKLANRYFPAPGSNRGFSPATYIRAFVLMRLEGGRCLEDIRHLQAESARLSMLGMKRLPGADALGDWLRRMGRSRAGLRGLEALNRHLLKAALGTRRSVTLDLDATAILCDKREARYTYQKERGYMPIVGHIAEVGMIVSQQFRHGNVPPSKDNLRFIVQCGAALPTGVKIGHLRIDAAGYQAAILDHAAEQGMAFAIRATLSKSLREQIQGLAASAWQPVVDRAGQSSEEESSCRLVHSMGASKRAFTLVLQRRPKWGQQSLDVGCGVDTDTYEQGGYVYRAIATNRDALSDSEVIHWYNQRGEHSENRIKELKCDFGGDRLPCGQFSANELYFALCALGYNLFALLRHLLPGSWSRSRAPTVRLRLIALAGKLVYHGRQWTLKLRPTHHAVLNEALSHVRRFALAP